MAPPSPERVEILTSRQSEAERRAGWVYQWLRWMPVITIPWMYSNLSNLGYRASPSEAVGAVLWPGVVHLVLLLGLRSPYLYARRHAQQALLLAGVRALSTMLLMGTSRGEGYCLWFIVNGALWLWGSARGLRQLKRGECWLMNVQGEGKHLPRPWALTTAAQPAAAMAGTPISEAPSSPRLALEQGIGMARQGRRAEAINNLLAAFRRGTPELRNRAAAELEKLGEVETF